ncbi:MAG TPA: hypothetical protein VKO18_00495 [Terriglobia bacterium]|nr:hypothetical protein [Terriglobia bacterium]
MPYDLATLTLSAMTQLGATLRRIGAGANSVEEVAQRVARLLYDELLDSATGAKACVLARFFFTTKYSSLDEDLRAFGSRLMKGKELQPDTRCLTLLATAGEKTEWNSRQKSEGHQTIPLPSEQVFQAIPMVSQLIKQLGIDVGTVLTPDPSLVLEIEQKTYNVFFVQDAAGSLFIPAQENFVIPYKVRSVLGFGGLLPSGDIYVVLLFTRVTISKDTADMFRNATMNLKVAMLPFLDRPVFEVPNYEQ